MPDTREIDAVACPGRMWTRRCRACGRHDLTAAFGRLALIGAAWSCPACRSERYERVALVMPGGATRPGGTRRGRS